MNEFSQQQSDENTTVKQKIRHQQMYKKIESIALSLNKSGLSYLTHGQFKQALEYFRKAQKIIQQQIQIINQSFSKGQFADITESENQQMIPNKQNNQDNQSENHTKRQNKDCQQLKIYATKQKKEVKQFRSQAEIKSRLIDKISKLQAITYNNLACYYKKTNKPKVALGYLKKSLVLEVQRVKDWTSIASTHLNICAIYSYIEAHQQAAEHALLAITMMEKYASQYQNLKQTDKSQRYSKNDSTDMMSSQQIKSFWNILMLSHYNLAIEYQYMKRFQQSSKQYKKALEIGRKGGKKNTAIIITCQQAIHRVQNECLNQRKKLIQLVKRRKENQEKGNYQFMRKNKRNYQNKNQKNLQQNSFENKIKKYSTYKNNVDGKNSTNIKQKYYPSNQDQRKNYTSVGKLQRKVKLEPLNNVEPISKTSNQRMHTTNS